jgi:hypothetical protein
MIMKKNLYFATLSLLLILVPGVAGLLAFQSVQFFDYIRLNAVQYQATQSPSSKIITVKAPSGMLANWNLTLPPDDGTSGQFLRTDGNGVTTWVTGGGGGGTVTGFFFSNANGVNGVVVNPTTAPDLTISLSDITPTSVLASGAISTSGGDISASTGQIIAGTNITLGTTGTLAFSGSTKITAPADGNLLVTNTAGGGTPLIAFGAVGPSNSALKGVGTEVQVRISDDAAFAGIEAGNGTFNALLTATANSTVTTSQGNGVIVKTVGSNGGSNTIELQSFNNTNFLNFFASNGTAASPTALTADFLIGCINAGGQSTTSRPFQAQICANAFNNWTGSDSSTYWTFFTTNRGSQSLTLRARMTDTGNFNLESGVFGLGSSTDPDISVERFGVLTMAAGAGETNGTANLCSASVANCIDFVQNHNLAKGTACTIQSGFGTGAAFVDGGCRDESIRLNVGTTPGTSGVITFGKVYVNIPACFAQDETTSVLLRTVTDAASVQVNGVFVNNDIIVVTCKGRL